MFLSIGSVLRLAVTTMAMLFAVSSYATQPDSSEKVPTDKTARLHHVLARSIGLTRIQLQTAH